jgi:Ca2+/Na+ antiporter
MKFFTDLLFTQYYELKSKGRPTKSAKNTGILLLSVLIILLGVTIFMALYTFGAFSITGSGSGRATGRLVGIFFLAVIYGSIYQFYGKQEKYEAIIRDYETLSDEEQNEVYKRGMKHFFIAFIVMLVLIVGLAVI